MLIGARHFRNVSSCKIGDTETISRGLLIITGRVERKKRKIKKKKSARVSITKSLLLDMGKIFR